MNRDRWHHQFIDETAFLDDLARLIPSAPVRLTFLERGIKNRIDLALQAYRADPTLPSPLHLDDGFGLLLTEARMYGVPELLVAFEYDPSLASREVSLYSATYVPELDHTEDDSEPA